MRKKIYFPSVLCIAVAALLGTAGGSSFAQTKEPIKIGVIANMGWPVGKSAAQAVQLGVKKINDEGGLLGRPLKLIEADSKGQVPNAVAEYRKLVMTDRVSMIVVAESGTLTLACQKAGAELFKEYPHIMMNAGASALEIPKNVRDNYGEYKFSFTLYTTGPDRYVSACMINTFLTVHQIKPRPKKVAILGEDLLDYNPYWQGWPEYGFRPYPDVAYKDRGVEVVYTTKIAVGEKMFLPIFEKIAASGAEYIDFAMSAYSDFYVLAKQWATSAARDVAFFHSGVSVKYWEVTNGACLGMVGWWPSDITNYEVIGKTREYVQGFYKTFGYPGSNWLAAGAYDDVLFWAEGVKQIKATEVENLIKALERIEVDCTRGKMKINPIDHCSHNYPYKRGYVEDIVKTVVEAPTAELTERWKRVNEKYGFFPYGFYPNGPLSPVSQWQNDGKIVLMYPLEVAKMSNPGQSYMAIKDLRARQK
jgi:branched-chain amino acid transport system substrate-binding protein